MYKIPLLIKPAAKESNVLCFKCASTKMSSHSVNLVANHCPLGDFSWMQIRNLSVFLRHWRLENSGLLFKQKMNKHFVAITSANRELAILCWLNKRTEIVCIQWNFSRDWFLLGEIMSSTSASFSDKLNWFYVTLQTFWHWSHTALPGKHMLL